MPASVNDLYEQFESRIIEEHNPTADRYFAKLTFFCGVSACLDLLLFNDEMPQEKYNELCESLVNGVQKEMMALHAQKIVEQTESGNIQGRPIVVGEQSGAREEPNGPGSS